ncbi:MAG: hypothetical protein MJ025_01535 [Victivallaceae bacterium]|nr:hypothetical protein [Victivallaceae bacterium]
MSDELDCTSIAMSVTRKTGLRMFVSGDPFAPCGDAQAVRFFDGMP